MKRLLFIFLLLIGMTLPGCISGPNTNTSSRTLSSTLAERIKEYCTSTDPAVRELILILIRTQLPGYTGICQSARFPELITPPNP